MQTEPRPTVEQFDFDKIFTFQPATPELILKYQVIRDKAKEFAMVMVANTPRCADQTAALRKIREAVMTANAAIALDGHV